MGISITPRGSYDRDFDAIKNRFPTMNAAFKDSFVAKLEFVKVLESSGFLSWGMLKREIVYLYW